MNNPFFYGRAVEGAAFINREEECRQIYSDLSRGQNIILFSPRRYGKTSLIKKTIKKLEKQGILCFFIDCYTITSLEAFYSTYSTALARGLKRPVDKLLSALHTLLPLIKPKLVYSEPGAPSIEIEASLHTLRRGQTLRELFESVEKYCAKKACRAAVIFDEFQEITILENGNVLEREMRAAFQHHTHVSYAFLGSKMHLMNAVFMDKNRPFYNFGTRIELETISSEAWKRDIVRKFKRGNYKIEPDAIKTILRYSQGHPYYTQLLCSEIWDTFHEKKSVSASDVSTVVDISIQKETHAFQELWDSLSRSQRMILHALAREPGIEIFSTEARHTYTLGAASSISRTIEQLRKRGIVTKRGRRYLLTDPFVGMWISKH
jgi:hypothetical protein